MSAILIITVVGILLIVLIRKLGVKGLIRISGGSGTGRLAIILQLLAAGLWGMLIWLTAGHGANVMMGGNGGTGTAAMIMVLGMTATPLAVILGIAGLICTVKSHRKLWSVITLVIELIVLIAFAITFGILVNGGK